MMNKPAETPVATTTAQPAGTEITSTAPAAPTAGEGLLLLSASPWGDLDRIVSKHDQREIALDQHDRSTPARLALEPGEYSVTVSGPAGRQKTIDVAIEAGKPTAHNVALGSVDVDALAKEVIKP